MQIYELFIKDSALLCILYVYFTYRLLLENIPKKLKAGVCVNTT